MGQNFVFFTRKPLLKKWYSFTLLILVVVLAIVWWGGVRQDSVTAKEVTAQTVQTSSQWQYGSFPVENFQGYTSPFGYRSSPSNPRKRQFHNGLDIAAPLGSYVRNWWTGKVTSLSDNTACGTSIQIRSGDWVHIYCHLNGSVKTRAKTKYLSDPKGGIEIRLGQTLAVGERMARIGMTGRTTGPHLHWSLKYRGKYVDPALVLQEMYKAQRGHFASSS